MQSEFTRRSVKLLSLFARNRADEARRSAQSHVVTSLFALHATGVMIAYPIRRGTGRTPEGIKDMLKKVSLVIACSAMLFLAVGAKAAAWDRKTTVTFNEAVELSGAVLPAGTYVFRVIGFGGTGNVVQVLNAEENQVITTFTAVPSRTTTPYASTYIGLEERPAGAPSAVREWFYPGMNFGLEFPSR